MHRIYRTQRYPVRGRPRTVLYGYKVCGPYLVDTMVRYFVYPDKAGKSIKKYKKCAVVKDDEVYERAVVLARLAAFAGGRGFAAEAGGAAAALEGCAGFECLRAYVAAPDPHYTWRDTGLRLSGTGLESKHKWTAYILNMTSQHWLSPEDSDRTVWTHLLAVVVPDNFDPSDNNTNAFGSMYMTGNCIDDAPPTADSEDLLVSAYLATHTATITATLFSIPACPITFAADPLHKRRYEDSIIAFTWSHFHDHPDQPSGFCGCP